jgi:hypothetical protein
MILEALISLHAQRIYEAEEERILLPFTTVPEAAEETVEEE